MTTGDGDSNQRRAPAAPVAEADGTGLPQAAEAGALEDVDDVPVDRLARPARAEAEARDLARPHRSDYARLFDALARLAQVSGTAPDLLTVYRALVQFACASCPANGLYVSRYDEERHERRCVYAWSEGIEEDVAAL